ncbi:metallophosphoesterase [Variovorax sp. RCC_210]|uniref:metallophosphoesterase n=1 Tax=Variovorax sp. RCC_210 TaxID=3239217 RepID=UPI00352534CB
MDENSVPEIKELAQVTVGRFVRYLQERNVPLANAHEGLHLACEALLAEDTDEFVAMIVGWFEAASGNTVKFDASVRSRLAGEFRAAAWMYEKKWVVYPYPGLSTGSSELEAGHLVKGQQIVVCSDIHLGTKSSRRDAFFAWLDQCRNTTIVLLGDILDLWIYSKSFNDAALARHIVAQWEDLWHKLEAARERSCQIHYVPGNHDAFVYFVESEDQDRWSRNIMSRTPLLRQIAEATQHRRFVSLGDIHYPCLRLRAGESDILFTHGHYADWGWRLMAGRADALTPLPTAVASASVILAHKNAALLRKGNNQMDWLKRTHLIEDTAISITNALLTAYEGAWDMMGRSADEFTALLDNASALYFGAQTRVSAAERLHIRQALLQLRLGEEKRESNLQAVKSAHLRYFTDRLSGSNGRLTMESGRPLMSSTALATFAKFDDLVFGHFHDPRDGDRVHDTGGFVDTVETFLSIEADGEVHRRALP